MNYYSMHRVLARGCAGAALACLIGACSSSNDRNRAPTIATIANQTIDQDTSTPAVGFSVGDRETAAAALTVTATSSDTTLVPTANLVLSGSGSSRTLVVTPVPDQSGSALITLTVADGAGLQASTSFTLTVNDTRVSFTTLSRQVFAADESTDTTSLDGAKFRFDGDDTSDAYDDLVAGP